MSERENPLFAQTIYRGHDYKQPGFYGVTVCTYHRRWFFGTIAGKRVLLNEAGCIAQQVWGDLAHRWPCVCLHEYVFMPNHMHGIVQLQDIPGIKPVSLFEVMRIYKGSSSYAIRKQVGDRWLGWQEGFWKTVILNENRLAQARQYIHNNPIKWAQDHLMHEDFKQYELRRSRA